MDKKNLFTKDNYGDNFGEKIIQKMIISTTHRGQNSNHFVTKIVGQKKDFPNFGLYFGHNLLPIADFSPLAKQPFCIEENILIFNGQIYNHLDIRKNLQHPNFNTHSDTETLAYFFEEILDFSPQQIFTKISTLNGMYACVYYAHQHHKIIVCRDKNAIKPLFCFENDDFLIIASEIRAILASGLVEKKLNLNQIPHYLTFKFAESPNTFFENIFEIKNNFVFDLINYSKTEEEHIINQKYPPNNTSKLVATSQILKDLDVILRNTVKRQLIADRPIGVFASGGIDSTLLLAYCQELGYQTTAYSAVNDIKEKYFGTNDFYFAEKSALQYGANYHPLKFSPHILQDLSDYVGALDQPIADSAGLLTYHLACEASNTHQVLLSGAGADEIFAGYNRHKAFFLYEKYHLKYFFWLKNFTKPIFKYILNPANFGHIFRKKIRLLDKIFSNIFWEKTPTFLGFTCLNIPLNNYFFEFFFRGKKEAIFSLGEALHYDKKHFLMQDILAITDQMTMQHTVEMRVPYLDHSIETFVSQFPAEFLLKNGKKWLLKEILKQKNGEIYTKRPKEGFGMPLGRWLQLPENTHHIHFLKNLPPILYEYLDKKTFEQNIKLHLQNKIDYSQEMWAVLILGLKIQNF